MVFDETISFKEKKSAVLTIRSYAILNDIVDFMHSHPDMNIRIETYTDSIGSKKANLLVTRNQADTIKSYFMANEIESHRILCTPHGESNPVASNVYKKGRKKNRRVDFQLQSTTMSRK